jgi:hypothetical protein
MRHIAVIAFAGYALLHCISRGKKIAVSIPKQHLHSRAKSVTLPSLNNRCAAAGLEAR